MDWKKEVFNRKEELIEKLSQLLSIKSVKDLSDQSEEAPMGSGIKEALDFMLQTAERDGFRTKNIDGYAGFAEWGPEEATDYIAILCHLDVVPATGEWESDPFSPEIRNGKLYARGAIDDKGPTMAAYYALKIIKESGLPLKHKIRIIFGTDEESGMSCMKRYMQMEPEALTGFAPDAEFPIIHAEKGQINAILKLKEKPGEQHGPINLRSFYAGEKGNMVPDKAMALVNGTGLETLKETFMAFGKQEDLETEAELVKDTLSLALTGKSAHGMEPFEGINAASKLAHFLAGKVPHPFVTFVSECLAEDHYGKRLGISFSDEITGPLTVNPGIFRFTQNLEGMVALNVRCPVNTPYLRTIEKLSETTLKYGFEVEEIREKKPHHVLNDSPVIKILQKAYEQETGEQAELLTTGGATYARFINSGVAFGAVFPGKENTAHQKDEYIELDDLCSAAVIYARAIYDLANH
ncbi:dipeptidase PepV [Cytobacillus firmus]|uniref:Acetylornithine deacetylase/Succinyl-diaminopimelate desuccinylase n=1 Tax=Cytobacillus firmus TaxID=1399 RepID=A0A7Y5AY21_CYTFI|nr:dipeptidase PepV [Cytobacillus firmus]KAF0824620.1 Acetylornithine deacetylase/Succinyl-diaminopimelate desuccinylase [Cytobacillus firmus]NUH83691.1 dipeptidase PepV [Cytobacillus firmus]